MEGKPARRCTNLVGIRLPWYVIYPEWLGRGRSLGAAGRPAGAGGRAPRGHPGLWPWEATDVENRGGATGGTMSVIATLRSSRAAVAGQLALAPLNPRSLRDQAYALLKDAIANTDIYSEREPLRLDERELVKALGVSRTPVREALSILEQEGFVRTVPRRGIFIVRKSRREIIEMIQVWAALESMSARLATLHAPDAEIGKLRHLFDSFQNSPPSDHIDEYSDANIAFPQMIIRRGGSRLIEEATTNLFLRLRAIRGGAAAQGHRSAHSAREHRHKRQVEHLVNGHQSGFVHFFAQHGGGAAGHVGGLGDLSGKLQVELPQPDLGQGVVREC